ncbi:MAG: hypothetical protein ABWZ02_02540 [Nakamurella sp.]
MTGAPQDPRWRALEIGPGGLPADRVRSIGPDGRVMPPVPPAAPTGGPKAAAAPGIQPMTAAQFSGGQYPQATPPHWPVAPQHPAPGWPPVAVSADSRPYPPPDSTPPSADFGSFDTDRRKPSRKALLAVLVLAVVVAAVTLSSLWADGGKSANAADLQPGDCLSSADERSVVVVDCTSPDVEFNLAAKYDGTRDAARCSTISTDLVLVTKDNTVLCLNYRATVGECLYAGDASRVGKEPCREPGSSTPFGLYRVVAVLPNTVDVRGCPTGTITSLVHVDDREVLCLGLP